MYAVCCVRSPASWRVVERDWKGRGREGRREEQVAASRSQWRTRLKPAWHRPPGISFSSPVAGGRLSGQFPIPHACVTYLELSSERLA
jgi:hypothetical protein